MYSFYNSICLPYCNHHYSHPHYYCWILGAFLTQGRYVGIKKDKSIYISINYNQRFVVFMGFSIPSIKYSKFTSPKFIHSSKWSHVLLVENKIVSDRDNEYWWNKQPLVSIEQTPGIEKMLSCYFMLCHFWYS